MRSACLTGCILRSRPNAQGVTLIPNGWSGTSVQPRPSVSTLIESLGVDRVRNIGLFSLRTFVWKDNHFDNCLFVICCCCSFVCVVVVFVVVVLFRVVLCCFVLFVCFWVFLWVLFVCCCCFGFLLLFLLLFWRLFYFFFDVLVVVFVCLLHFTVVFVFFIIIIIIIVVVVVVIVVGFVIANINYLFVSLLFEYYNEVLYIVFLMITSASNTFIWWVSVWDGKNK